MAGVSVIVVMQEEVEELANVVTSDESPESIRLLDGLTSERTIFPEVVGILDKIMLLEGTDGKFETLEDGRLRM